jgi:hypothetical protein
VRRRWCRRRTAALVAAALLAPLAAGCGGGSGGGSTTSASGPGPASSEAAAPATPFAQALAGVRATEATGAYVEWSDLDALYEAAGVARPAPGERADLRGLGRWRGLLGIGGGAAVATGVLLRDDTGIDPLGAEQLLSAGMAPDQRLRITGRQDEAGVRAGLQAAGYTEATSPGGSPLLVRPDPDDAGNVGSLRAFGYVALTGADVVAGGTAEAVDDLLSPTPSLADSAPHRAVASCLGDGVAAVLLGGPVVERRSGLQLVGLGLGARGADAVNVICLAGDAAGAPDREAALRAAVDPTAMDEATRARVSEQVASAEVTTQADGDLTLVRAELVLTADAPADYVWRRLLQLGDVGLLGGDTAEEQPGSSTGGEASSEG